MTYKIGNQSLFFHSPESINYVPQLTFLSYQLETLPFFHLVDSPLLNVRQITLQALQVPYCYPPYSNFALIEHSRPILMAYPPFIGVYSNPFLCIRHQNTLATNPLFVLQNQTTRHNNSHPFSQLEFQTHSQLIPASLIGKYDHFMNAQTQFYPNLSPPQLRPTSSLITPIFPDIMSSAPEYCLTQQIQPPRTDIDTQKAHSFKNRTLKFQNLTILLNLVFIEGKISEDEFHKLSPFENKLFTVLMKRKFRPYNIREPKQSVLTPSIQDFLELIKSQNIRRPEEGYKFILTRVLKFLKKESKIPFLHPSDHELYDNYFGECATKNQIPISDYHYPLTGFSKGKSKLNGDYFAKIFSSAKFVKALREYIAKNLVCDYKKKIAWKIKALLEKWEMLFVEFEGKKEQTEMYILDYLLRNKRCKLPWSILEIEESVEKFKRLMSPYLSRNLIED